MKNLLFASSVIALLVLIIFGVSLCFDPYLLTGYYRTESITVWNVREEAQALILFNLSSRGFLTTNYPVEVSVNIIVLNETLLSFLKEKMHVDLDIAGTYSYPVRYGPLGIYQGSISLQIESNNKFHGTSNVIFPYKGDLYYFSIFAYDTESEYSPPIYTMNVSDIGKSIPPVFKIEESYSYRVQFEDSNRRTGLTIIALAVSGLGIVINIRQRSAYEYPTKSLPQEKKKAIKRRPK